MSEHAERSVHSVFRFADPATVGKSLLDGNEDHLLNQARSELMKQEHQVGPLNNCIDELQQQACAQRLELEDAHHGYIESRRAQFRLQEGLSIKEKALRETHIRKKPKIGELKRKSRDTTKARFTNAGNARANEFCE